MYKTKGGKPDLIDVFYRSFVQPIKMGFEHNLGFINRCIDQFFQNQKTYLREPKFIEKRVKDFKKKLDQLEKINLPRFKAYCDKGQEKGEIQKMKEKYKARDLQTLKGLGNLFTIFPEYLDYRLENLCLSRMFDKINYASFFLKDKGIAF